MTPVDRYQSCCTVPGWVITSAVRYARGRATYIVGMTVDLLIQEWEHIHPHDQVVILCDLQEEMYWRQETEHSSLSRVDDPDWERAWQYCRDHAPKEWEPDTPLPPQGEPITPIDRAVRLIELYGTRTGSPRDVALELAIAGLLTPDLPKGTGDPEDILEWRPVPGLPKAVIWAGDQNRPIMIQNVEPGDLTPDEAREVAYALLAAADYSEGQV